jgi:hypothetical protein
VEGQKAVESRRKGAPIAKVPPKLAGVSTGAATMPRKSDSGSSARKKAMETGSLEDVAAALSA